MTADTSEVLAAPTNTSPASADGPRDNSERGEALPARMRPRWLHGTTLALALVGLADSIYLTISHYTGGAVLACGEQGAVNCARVTTSTASRLVGIPVADLGIVYFLLVVGLCLPSSWRRPSTTVFLLRLASLTAGTAFVLYLIYAELVLVHAICLYCTGIHVVTLLLFCLVVGWGPRWAGD